MHNSKPTISVIIPAYNSAKYIGEAIKSALNQTYPVHEIIVVDDGSTDGTAEMVKKIASGKMGQSPSGTVPIFPITIKYIYQENRGPAAARNRGIREAKGDYIAFLDSDDIWLPEKIELQTAKFKKDENYAMIHAARMRIGLDGITQPIKSCSVKEGFVFENLLEENFICSSSVLLKKSCLDAVGFFDEDKRVYKSEDYDLWLRIAGQYKIGFVKMPLVKYRVNPAGHNRSNIVESYEAQKFVFLKALEFYKGDREKAKKERLCSLYRRMAASFFYIKDYKNSAAAIGKCLLATILLYIHRGQ